MSAMYCFLAQSYPFFKVYFHKFGNFSTCEIFFVLDLHPLICVFIYIKNEANYTLTDFQSNLI